MAKYSIQDTTLTAIGDAIRNKSDKHTRVEYVYNKPLMEVVKTPNAIGFDSFLPNQIPASDGEVLIINIPEAKKIKMKLGWRFGSDAYFIRINNANDGSFLARYDGKASLGIKETLYAEDIFDTNNLKFYTYYSESIFHFFYAEFYALDEDGNEILVDSDIPREVIVPNTLTPARMAEEIEALHVYYPPEEAFKFTGDCQYKFAEDSFTWFIQEYGDKITTEKISNVSNMFRNSGRLTKIPFEINLTTKVDDLGSMFYGCSSLTDIANINITSVKKASNLFSQCKSLRKLPDCVLTWDLTAMNEYTYGSSNGMFQSCYSLRNIPSEFLKKLYGGGISYNYHLFYNFYDLFSIDELIGLPVSPAAFISNIFNNGFKNFWRAKELIFDTNADGSVKTVTWKNQSFKLDQYVGYVDKKTIYDEYITSSNNGITADKEVKDDATYQTLKNDPDWFTRDINYSRYNHNSAVNTINSLPDVSSGSGNTITFTGASGALTDGGAISNLTEEEIAVAAAKGWTVTLV